MNNSRALEPRAAWSYVLWSLGTGARSGASWTKCMEAGRAGGEGWYARSLGTGAQGHRAQSCVGDRYRTYHIHTHETVRTEWAPRSKGPRMEPALVHW